MAGKYSFVSQDKFKDWLKAEGKPFDSVLYFRINFVLSKIYIYIFQILWKSRCTCNILVSFEKITFYTEILT